MKSYQELKIVFFGTPDFAVASLKALLDAQCNVVAVVTAPDKPSGRGLQLNASPVKQFAMEHNLPVLQPAKLKDPEFLQLLKSYAADIHIVVAFRMLPEAVWNMPPMGTVNVHGSLLPQYRGAAPINWAIINGEKETGVTTFKLKHEIDTGDILLNSKVPINDADNAGSVYGKLMSEGASLLVKTIEGLANGSIREQPQPLHNDSLKHAPKIFKEDMQINWDKPVRSVWNHIRGLSPYPAAFTQIAGKNFKVYAAHFDLTATNVAPGTIETDQKQYLRIAAADGWIYIDELQQEGKKRMDIASFLRGFRLS